MAAFLPAAPRNGNPQVHVRIFSPSCPYLLAPPCTDKRGTRDPGTPPSSGMHTTRARTAGSTYSPFGRAAPPLTPTIANPRCALVSASSAGSRLLGGGRCESWPQARKKTSTSSFSSFSSVPSWSEGSSAGPPRPQQLFEKHEIPRLRPEERCGRAAEREGKSLPCGAGEEGALNLAKRYRHG